MGAPPLVIACLIFLAAMHATNLKREREEREWRRASREGLREAKKHAGLIFRGAQKGEPGHHLYATSDANASHRPSFSGGTFIPGLWARRIARKRSGLALKGFSTNVPRLCTHTALKGVHELDTLLEGCGRAACGPGGLAEDREMHSRCEWFLKWFCCCFCMRHHLLSSDERRARSEVHKREMEAVRAVSRLYMDLFRNKNAWRNLLIGSARMGRRRPASMLKRAMRDTMRLRFTQRVVEQRADQDGLWNRTAGGTNSALGGGVQPSAAKFVKALPQMEHYIKYAIGIYGWRMLSLTHPQEFHLNAGYFLQDDMAFRSYAGVDPSCILAMRLRAETYRPAYALCVDHDSRSVVLAIRGSMNSGDLLTDAAAYSVPFRNRNYATIGFAHMGILRAAEELVEELRDHLQAAMRRFKKYHLTICGHSLGGGAAAVVAAILKYRERFMHSFGVFAFCPPPVLDRNLAEGLKREVVCCISGDDFVSRLSYHNIKELNSRAEKHAKVAAYDDGWAEVWAAEEHEAKASGNEASEADREHELYLPGTVLHFESHSEEREKGLSGWLRWLRSRAWGRGGQSVYTLAALDHTATGELQHIIISNRMFLDHFPSVLQRRVCTLRAGEGLQPVEKRWREEGAKRGAEDSFDRFWPLLFEA